MSCSDCAGNKAFDLFPTKMCKTCNNNKCHVYLEGDILKDMSSEDLKLKIARCRIKKPLHIIKRIENMYVNQDVF